MQDTVPPKYEDAIMEEILISKITTHFDGLSNSRLG